MYGISFIKQQLLFFGKQKASCRYGILTGDPSFYHPCRNGFINRYQLLKIYRKIIKTSRITGRYPEPLFMSARTRRPKPLVIPTGRNYRKDGRGCRSSCMYFIKHRLRRAYGSCPYIYKSFR